MTTLAPLFAIASATHLSNPDPAPVITTILPETFYSSQLFKGRILNTISVIGWCESTQITSNEGKKLAKTFCYF